MDKEGSKENGNVFFKIGTLQNTGVPGRFAEAKIINYPIFKIVIQSALV